MNCEGVNANAPKPTFEELLAHLPPDAGLKHIQQLFGYSIDREFFRGLRGHLFNTREKKFNIPNARWLCEASWLAYEDDREKIQKTLRRIGFKEIHLLGEPIAAIIAKRGTSLFIIFPGTDPLRLQSWLVNIDSKPAKIPGTVYSVHRGYLKHLIKIETQFRISRFLSDHRGRVFISGHSQGGSLAAISGLYYSQISRNVRPEDLNVYAFGAPGTLFARPDVPCPFRLYRVSNGNDPVPNYPDRSLHRVGEPVYIDELGEVHVGKEQPSYRVIAPDLAIKSTFEGKSRICIAAALLSPLLDHALTGYESRLRSAIFSN